MSEKKCNLDRQSHEGNLFSSLLSWLEGSFKYHCMNITIIVHTVSASKNLVKFQEQYSWRLVFQTLIA